MFKSYSPKLSDVSFHKDSWELHEDLENNKAWFTDKGDPARVQLFLENPGWPFDLRDAAAARSFFDAQSKELGGAMLELQVETFFGVETLSGTFKYKSPIPEHLGKYYVGVYWIPFNDFLFQVNFESLEQETTGLREAAVMAMEGPSSEKTPEDLPLVSSPEDLQKLYENAAVQTTSSDHPKYDASFPEHPLTKVRMYKEDFRYNVMFNKSLKKQKVYRV